MTPFDNFSQKQKRKRVCACGRDREYVRVVEREYVRVVERECVRVCGYVR